MRAGASRGLARALSVVLLAGGFALPPAAIAEGDGLAPKRAMFARERASRETRHVADWVVHAGDNRAPDSAGLPFVIIDKRDARIFVFDPDGRLLGAAPALLGMARGDDSIPGIGDRDLSTIGPGDRTTPAGRFTAGLSVDAHGADILMVDYERNVAIHRVITTNPKERRLHRLATPTPLDNRISFGCINVPAKFYDEVVRPAFTGTNGIVYVLPETRPADAVFSSYDIDERAQRTRSIAVQRSPKEVIQ